MLPMPAIARCPCAGGLCPSRSLRRDAGCGRSDAGGPVGGSPAEPGPAPGGERACPSRKPLGTASGDGLLLASRGTGGATNPADVLPRTWQASGRLAGMSVFKLKTKLNFKSFPLLLYSNVTIRLRSRGVCIHCRGN